MFLRMCLQLAYERKFLPLKRNRPLPIYARFKRDRGTENVRDKYLNFHRDRRSTLERATERPLRPFRKKSFGSVHESLSRGTQWRSRGRAKRRNKKSTETESVYIGIQWLRLNCGFSGRAKMEK